MTMLLTIVSGFTVLVLGQIFIRLFIEPVQELKKTIAIVQFTMSKLAHIIHNPNSFCSKERSEVFKELRELSAKLAADLSLVPCYGLTGSIFLLPKLCGVRAACINIVTISNLISLKISHKFAHITQNMQYAHDNLGLYYPVTERISQETLDNFINLSKEP
jgi:hypothetical protein